MNSDGTRWCILATENHRGALQEATPTQLPEPLFLAYQ
jgi:hypothetical protein